MDVPEEIIKLANEYLSGHTDGFVKRGLKEKLQAIQEFITLVLNKK